MELFVLSSLLAFYQVILGQFIRFSVVSSVRLMCSNLCVFKLKLVLKLMLVLMFMFMFILKLVFKHFVW